MRPPERSSKRLAREPLPDVGWRHVSSVERLDFARSGGAHSCAILHDEEEQHPGEGRSSAAAGPLAALLALSCFSLASQSQDTWRGLTVAPESRCSAYDPGRLSVPAIRRGRDHAEMGIVYSPYTGEWFDDKYETDIEHIVARSEAHDSGLCAADAATRRRFTRDLRNLTLANPRLNRYEKRAKDAAEWMPDKNRCWFAHRVVEVRRAYSLTINRREADALDAVLNDCRDSKMTVYASDKFPATRVQDLEGEESCGPYKNCTELRKDHPRGVPKGHCAYQSSMDRDQDGWACER